MRIIIDQEKCIGCGSCTAVCPKVFEMDENNKVRLKDNNLEAAKKDCVKEAVEICAVQAIKVEDKEVT